MESCGETYIDRIVARGHRNIRATHRSTFEITREDMLTPRGDCIVAVSANKALKDLDPALRNKIRSGWAVAVLISVGGLWDIAIGHGDPRLDLEDPVRIVVRKSMYISTNTLMIRSDKAASDLRRDLIDLLRRGGEAAIYVIVSKDPGCLRNRAEEILGSLGVDIST